MNNDIYDVLKMQMDHAEDAIRRKEQYISESEKVNNMVLDQLKSTQNTLDSAKALLKNLGIDVENDLDEARKRANKKTDRIITEIDETCKVQKRDSTSITYDELVRRAHEEDYINTQIKDLLTEEEIRNADRRFANIEATFASKTRLNKTDIAFLGTAIALQVVRQYVLDPLIKGSRIHAGAQDEKGHGNKGGGWYRVPTENILENTVPFDAIRYSANSTVQGFLRGQNNHRDVTLGHDPLLGWIFGTANIMTGTITNCSFNSAHVKYVPGKGNVIHSQADTLRIFTTILDRVTNEGLNGKLALALALVREAIHLKSDIGTKHSLPLPSVNVLCPELGSKLLEYGIDVASVGTESSLAFLINLIISMLHRLIKPEGEDDKLYEVRTRKILLISNCIATSSNLIAVGIGTVSENPNMVRQSMKYLDVGGTLVTITRLFSDIHFITKVKEEFINEKLNAQLIEDLNRLDMYLQDYNI